MSIARVYLSVFPSEKAEEMVKNINDNMKSFVMNWVLVFVISYVLSLN